MTDLVEEWRWLPGYEGTYRVSPEGRIESIARPRTKGGILVQKINKRGYPAVTLVQFGKQDTREVHKLVALAFLGPRLPGMEVRHLDGDSANCTLANLKYGTRSENMFDQVRHGTHANGRRTHCAHGHEFTRENTRVTPSRPNARYCRTCQAARAKSKNRHPDYLPEWAV